MAPLQEKDKLRTVLSQCFRGTAFTFVQDIIRFSKAANLTSVQNQLTMAWNNLDWEFRLHIPEYHT